MLKKIEAIYGYLKMILNIAQDARHHHYNLWTAGKLEWFVKFRGIWP